MRTFSAKTLLFGEYSILVGGEALIFPLDRFSGRLERAAGRMDEKSQRSNEKLGLFLTYLEAMQQSGDTGFQLDLAGFRGDLERGLFFRSGIPENYGVGSSGALVAAVFDQYRKEGGPLEISDLGLLRSFFARMESFFHGQSSGIDPLCVYLDAPLLAGEQGTRTVTIPEMSGKSGFFMLDSGIISETGILVRAFFEQLEQASFRTLMEKKYTRFTTACIDAVLTGNKKNLPRSMQQLSEIQWKEFPAMIPDSVKSTWKSGLQTGLFSLKLCGSGGGGFMLGWAPDLAAAMEWFRERGTRIIPLDLNRR